MKELEEIPQELSNQFLKVKELLLLGEIKEWNRMITLLFYYGQFRVF